MAFYMKNQIAVFSAIFTALIFTTLVVILLDVPVKLQQAHPVLAWGNNQTGQLGTGIKSLAEELPKPAGEIEHILKSGPFLIREISAGIKTSCMITDDGTAWCWGGGDSKNLETLPPAIRKVRDLPLMKSFSTSGGGAHCSYSQDDKLWCWGLWTPSVLDYQNMKWAHETENSKKYDELRSSFIRFYPGDRNFCALTNKHELWCWGSEYGDSSHRFESPAPIKIGLNGAPVDVRVSLRNTCALLEDRTGVCWQNQKSPVPREILSSEPISQIYSSNDQNCALKMNKTVWCWHSDKPRDARPILTSGQKELSNIVKIAHGGQNLFCALGDEGFVWCWEHAYNQASTARLVKGPYGILPLKRVKDIYVGGDTGYALMESALAQEPAFGQYATLPPIVTDEQQDLATETQVTPPSANVLKYFKRLIYREKSVSDYNKKVDSAFKQDSQGGDYIKPRNFEEDLSKIIEEQVQIRTAAFRMYDLNSDNQLTSPEIQDYLEKNFKNYGLAERNKDLETAEVERHLAYDHNKDGIITHEEIRTISSEEKALITDVTMTDNARLYKLLEDHSQGIQRTEFDLMAQKVFDYADMNGDGFISSGEFDRFKKDTRPEPNLSNPIHHEVNLPDIDRVADTEIVISNLKKSIMKFRDIYDAYPGDLMNAENKLPDCKMSYCRSGNGDGLISPSNISKLDFNGDERISFWIHLLKADLIKGIWTENYTGGPHMWGVILPANPLSGGFHIYTHIGGQLPHTFKTITAKPGLYLVLTNDYEGAYASDEQYALTAKQALMLDQKIDDGLPFSGDVIATGKSDCFTKDRQNYNEFSNNSQQACASQFIYLGNKRGEPAKAIK